MSNLYGSGLSDGAKYANALAAQTKRGGTPFNGPTASIRADYEEFRPETFKGFTVELSEEPGANHGHFQTEAEAEAFAHSRAERVYFMSSCDHYKQDVARGIETVI